MCAEPTVTANVHLECVSEVSEVMIRYKSVRHAEFSKFEIFDIRPSQRSDFASSYKILRKSHKPSRILEL